MTVKLGPPRSTHLNHSSRERIGQRDAQLKRVTPAHNDAAFDRGVVAGPAW
jgi:hypothetical protein